LIIAGAGGHAREIMDILDFRCLNEVVFLTISIILYPMKFVMKMLSEMSFL
jgi:hypothetical protein